ncbi:MAG: AAA family ATPase [Deltaproteobacteria bacterium]|nr:AAA family ATPase [Deltaproteobacteria bacterium]
MYSSYFGLKEKPFNLPPDPSFLFLARGHREALDHLLYGVTEKKGFIAITGDIGCGKTTLCRVFLEKIDGLAKTALIFNSFLSDFELLRAINEEFGLPAQGETRKDLIDQLNRFLLDELASAGNAVLIIDESQNLAPDVLEQIRMLSNLEANNQKLIQIVLVGQPELQDILSLPGLRQLNERITVRCHLPAMTVAETERYLYHRLNVAGDQGAIIFTPQAIKAIYSYSKGIPRRINAIADRSLLIAYVNESFKITDKFVANARREIETGTPLRSRAAQRSIIPIDRRPRPGFKTRLVAVIAGLTALIILGVLVYRGYHPGSRVIGASPQPASRPTPAAVASSMPTAHPSTPGPAASAPSKPLPPTSDFQPGAPSVPDSGSPGADGNIQTGVDPAVQFPLKSGGRAFSDFLILAGQPPLPPTSPGLDGDKDAIASLARARGLTPTATTAGLDLLSRFTQPYILVFSLPDGRQAFLAAKTLPGGQLAVVENYHKIKTVPVRWIDRAWFGRVILFLADKDSSGIRFGVGMQGEIINQFQKQLSQLGYLKAPPTGQFDQLTEAAVKRFQRDHRLEVDGRIGPLTRAMLFQLTGNI